MNPNFGFPTPRQFIPDLTKEASPLLNNRHEYLQWGTDSITGEYWQYVVDAPPSPPYDAVAEAKKAAEAKRVREESMAELFEIAEVAQKWNDTSISEWNHWGNQCSDQALALRQYLAHYKEWKYWDFSKNPAQGSVGHIFYHNVVVLNPMNDNPLGETVIDGWHFWGDDTARQVYWESLKEWQKFWTPDQSEWYYFGCK
jgi:hypothetical protein